MRSMEADVGCAPLPGTRGVGSVSRQLRTGSQDPSQMCLLAMYMPYPAFEWFIKLKNQLGNSLKQNIQKEQGNEQRLGTFPLTVIKNQLYHWADFQGKCQIRIPTEIEVLTARLHTGAYQSDQCLRKFIPTEENTIPYFWMGYRENGAKYLCCKNYQIGIILPGPVNTQNPISSTLIHHNSIKCVCCMWVLASFKMQPDEGVSTLAQQVKNQTWYL